MPRKYLRIIRRFVCDRSQLLHEVNGLAAALMSRCIFCKKPLLKLQQRFFMTARVSA